jgi:hypothetical protein
MYFIRIRERVWWSADEGFKTVFVEPHHREHSRVVPPRDAAELLT